MTLNAKIGGFMDFVGDFGFRHTFQEPVAPKLLDIDRDNLRMKFSALGHKRSFR